MDKLTQKDKQKIQRQKRKETIARIAAMQTLPYEVSSFDKLEYALEVYCNGAFVRQIDVYDTYEEATQEKEQYQEPLFPDEYLRILCIAYGKEQEIGCFHP